MLYFANPSTDAIRDQMLGLALGCILTPAQGNKLPGGCLWLADNGCGPGSDGRPGKGYPGDERYLGFLQDLWAAEGSDPCDSDTSGCCFGVAPDVVGDAEATLRRSYMLGWIRYLGMPAALVAQNGLERLVAAMGPRELEEFWDGFDVLFLGGSPGCLPCGYVRPVIDRDTRRCPHCTRPLAEWKLSAAARALVAEAKRRRKQVHMGRVNSYKRLAYAVAIGCDTADGTYMTRAPDRYLPVVIGWQRDVAIKAATQAALFDVTGLG